MVLYCALLRGINVGGKKNVAMADLVRLCTGLGLKNPRSLLNSGNLVFAAGSRAGDGLERLLETETKKQLGLDTHVMIRTAEEWKRVTAENPLKAEAKNDPGHLLVLFLKTPVTAARVSALQEAIVGREFVRGKGRHLYVSYPDGVGRSKLTLTLIESRLGTRGTARNWNTVMKLGTLLGL
ncbi:MAG: DUF1697 domain-containing protein [Bacteroidota bacterium]